MMPPALRLSGVFAAVLLSSCSSMGPTPSTSGGGDVPGSGPIKVGPPNGGAVIPVGGGAQGPEVFARFIELAGGPDALIVTVPTAGGDSVYPANSGQGGLRAAGARNVITLHTKNRAVADADSFVAPLKRAGGVWFAGGRHYHLVDSYLGTKTEQEFHNILARGGVMAGSSAGASILGSFLVRGAPSNNNRIMAHPQYLKGFGFLRGVAVDQHVVARSRLADLADSITPRWPQLLSISEDEGTAWVVRGDTAEVIGRNKAFAYNGKENDPGKPFLTLHPGDRYNLATRRVMRRAYEDTPITPKFVDDVFSDFGKRGGPTATVVIAQAGKVLYNKAYGIPRQPSYTPETAAPNFPLGAISNALNATVVLDAVRARRMSFDDPIAAGTSVTVRQFLSNQQTVPDGGRKLVQLVTAKSGAQYAATARRRVNMSGGLQRTTVDSVTGAFQSNVDDLYRFEQALNNNRALWEDSTGASIFAGTLGWRADTYRGLVRQSAFGTADGKRNAYVRFPATRTAIIILTSSDAADARALADKIADKLFSASR